jgi:hypothetical protein
MSKIESPINSLLKNQPSIIDGLKNRLELNFLMTLFSKASGIKQFTDGLSQTVCQKINHDGSF